MDLRLGDLPNNLVYRYLHQLKLKDVLPEIIKKGIEKTEIEQCLWMWSGGGIFMDDDNGVQLEPNNLFSGQGFPINLPDDTTGGAMYMNIEDNSIFMWNVSNQSWESPLS